MTVLLILLSFEAPVTVVVPSWCVRTSQQAHHHHLLLAECCQSTSGLLSSAAAGIENEFFIDNILIKIKDYNERTNQIVPLLPLT